MLIFIDAIHQKYIIFKKILPTQDHFSEFMWFKFIIVICLCFLSFNHSHNIFNIYILFIIGFKCQI